MSQTKNRTVSDFLRFEANPNYCRRQGTLTNPSGAAVMELTNPVGTPVKRTAEGAYTVVINSDIANATGFLLEDEDIPEVAISGTTTKKYAILDIGPASCDKAMMPTADFLGTNFTMATLITAALARQIRLEAEPTKISTGSTTA